MKKQIILFVVMCLMGMGAYATPGTTITSFSPASGPVGTLVTITGTNLSSPTLFKIGGKAAIVVSNNGTTLVGMVMPGAATGAVAVTALSAATGGSNFTVTQSLRPGSQQGAKLYGTGTSGEEGQGNAVAISADGNTAIVGASGDDGGSVFIYTRSGTTWTQQGSKLVGTGGTGIAHQGYSLSLRRWQQCHSRWKW